MMLTLTAEYALRAMIHLSRNMSDWPISGQEIARRCRIPRKYLSAVLADLVRAGVLEASRGKNGGFRMARPREQIRLVEVLAPFEPVLANRRPCPFGNVVCNDDQPCAGHFRWKAVREAYYDFVNGTSVRDVTVADDERGNSNLRERSRKRRGRRESTG